MRTSALLFVLTLAPAAFADDAKALSPAEAAKKINERVVVEMEVKSTGGNTNRYLNSEKDYRSDDNFTIFLPGGVLEKFKDAQIEDPAIFYMGKTIRVTGVVILVDEKPQIKIANPDQIKVVEKK
jgi:DNA/RNA endonuclease YhcR with UshA esterase domain